LKAYRQRAEEILDDHFDIMEKTQIAHDHELAILKAENAKLRELVGKAGDPSFPQSVLFQSIAPVEVAPKSKKDLKNKMKQGADDDDHKPAPTSRKGKSVKNEPNADKPGGTWQNFMAWVPNGAALMNPEPWKPLQDLSQVGGPPGSKSQKFVGGASAAVQDFWNVLPGANTDTTKTSPNRKIKEDSEDGDSDSEEMSLEEQGKLELVEMWKATDKDRKSRKERNSGELDSRCDSEQDLNVDEQPHSRFILNPDSLARISWDLSSLFMVIFDMIMVPMQVFEMPDHAFLVAMDWTTRVFWTTDMGWSCCTGVVLKDGSVEYRWRSILNRYVKSWLALDLFIVGSDWSTVIMMNGDGMGVSRLARVSRVARVVRLLRLVRMQEVITNITERIQADNTLLLLQIFKLLVFLIACSHITACGWWGVGDISSGKSWIKEYQYDTEDVGLQYLVSLHWALSQFAGGIETPAPQTTFERFYTVAIWVISFISFLVMLSFLTSSLTQQYIIGGSGARQMATLKKYLNQNKIPKNLIKRLCRSAKHAISGDLQADSVELLHVISEPLKVEMHYEMYSRILACHPFFLDFLNRGNQVMRRITHSCMSMLLLDCGDVLFRRGDEPADPRMYVVFSGVLEYVDKYLEQHKVVEKQWISEPALWTNWKHQGTLTAITDAKMAVLDAEQFQDVCSHYMKKSKMQDFNPKSYAAKFVEELNETSDLSDLATD
jgi:hypothetical protein